MYLDFLGSESTGLLQFVLAHFFEFFTLTEVILTSHP